MAFYNTINVVLQNKLSAGEKTASCECIARQLFMNKQGSRNVKYSTFD